MYIGLYSDMTHFCNDLESLSSKAFGKTVSVDQIESLFENNLRRIHYRMNHRNTSPELKDRVCNVLLAFSKRINDEFDTPQAHKLAFEIQGIAQGIVRKINWVEFPTDLQVTLLSHFGTTYSVKWDAFRKKFEKFPKTLINFSSRLFDFSLMSKCLNLQTNKIKQDWDNQNVYSLKKKGCKTPKDAVDYIIKNKLDTANLLEFPDLNNDDLERLVLNRPDLEYLFIKSKIEKVPSPEGQSEPQQSGPLKEEALAAALEQLFHLKGVFLINCDQIKGNHLALALEKHYDLKHLVIQGCHQIDADALRKILFTFTKLQELVLEDCSIKGLDLADALQLNTNLETLYLRGCHILDLENFHVKNSLETVCENLSYLKEWHLPYDDKSRNTAVFEIRNSKTKKQASSPTPMLHGATKSSSAAEDYAINYPLTGTSLLELALHSNKDGFEKLVINYPNLEILKITGFFQEDALASALEKLSNLKCLVFLNCNQIKGDKLSKALEKHKNLNKIVFCNCAQFDEILSKLINLQFLELADCSIKGIKLAHALEKNPKLEYLYLTSCTILDVNNPYVKNRLESTAGKLNHLKYWELPVLNENKNNFYDQAEKEKTVFEIKKSKTQFSSPPEKVQFDELANEITGRYQDFESFYSKLADLAFKPWNEKITLSQLESLINNNLSLLYSEIFAPSITQDFKQRIFETLLTLSRCIFKSNSAAIKLAFEIQGIAQGLVNQVTWKALPKEAQNLILSHMTPKVPTEFIQKKFQLGYEQIDLKNTTSSDLNSFASTSTNSNKQAIKAKKIWETKNPPSLKKLGCRYAYEAIDYIIQHQLPGANLLEFPHINNDHLDKLAEQCPHLKYLLLNSKIVVRTGKGSYRTEHGLFEEEALADAIGKMHELECLVLAGCSQINGDVLAPVLKKHHCLKQLVIRSDTGWDNKFDPDILESMLISTPNLQHVEVDHWKMSGMKLAEFLESHPNLEYLSLPYCHIIDIDSSTVEARLAAAFAKLGNLKQLILHDLVSMSPRRSKVKGKMLTAALGKLTNLQLLDIRCCDELDKDELIQAIGYQKNLRHLNLAYCKQISITNLLPELEKLTYLESLDISCDDFGGRSSVSIEIDDQFLSSFKKLTNLKNINFSNCHFYYKDHSLAELILCLPQLEHLNLSKCNFNFGHDGLTELAALASCTRLKYLNLRKCRSIGGKELAEALGHLTLLEHLDLRECVNIDGDKLRESLQKLVNLKELNLSYCNQINGDMLINALEKLTKLETLQLTGCELNLSKVELLLEKLPHLKMLDMNGCSEDNDLRKKLHKQIKAKYPNCRCYF